MQLDFVGSVVHAAARADLDVLLSSSGGDHDLSFERLVSKGRVDGVIIMEIRVEDARVGSLRRSGLPFVGIGHTDADDQMSWIDIDYAGLIRSSVRHLADLGHRKVALVSRSPELVTAGYGPARRAREGFCAAVAERGLHGVEVMCGDDGRSGQECVEQLLHEHADLTAITTIDEAALPGIQRALADAGPRAPHDFSITGVAARLWAEDFRPPLTAAEVPAQEMGEKAVSPLIERIATPLTPPRHIMLAPPISLRSSTGAARIRGGTPAARDGGHADRTARRRPF